MDVKQEVDRREDFSGMAGQPYHGMPGRGEEKAKREGGAGGRGGGAGRRQQL